MSGTDLGKILNLKKSPLTDWKNKKSKPTLEQIVQICEYFDVSSDFLLFGKQENYKNKPSNPPLNDSDIELLNLYHSIPRQEQAIFLGEMYKVKKQFNNKKVLANNTYISTESKLEEGFLGNKKKAI